MNEWLWGWDPTPGIVSVWASNSGEATVWRRIPETGALVREAERFRPWMLLDSLADLAQLGARLAPEGSPDALITYRELEGGGELRFLVSATDFKILTTAVLDGASRRLGRRVGHIGDLEDDSVLALPPDEQYLVATGRTYFKDLSFDSLHRLQFDLETTGLNPEHDRVFMISIRYPDGETEVLEARKRSDAAEAELLRELMARVASADPDVIE